MKISAISRRHLPLPLPLVRVLHQAAVAVPAAAMGAALHAAPDSVAAAVMAS